jgi:hypothetical protein
MNENNNTQPKVNGDAVSVTINLKQATIARLQALKPNHTIEFACHDALLFGIDQLEYRKDYTAKKNKLIALGRLAEKAGFAPQA